MGRGAGVVDRCDNVTLMGQCTRQPVLIVPIASESMGEHHQWVLASRGWRVANCRNTDKHHIVADQLWGDGRCTGIPDDHLQRTLIVWVRQGGGLKADRVDVSESAGRQTG